jgi:hypothetical protein
VDETTNSVMRSFLGALDTHIIETTEIMQKDRRLVVTSSNAIQNGPASRLASFSTVRKSGYFSKKKKEKEKKRKS